MLSLMLCNFITCNPPQIQWHFKKCKFQGEIFYLLPEGGDNVKMSDEVVKPETKKKKK